MSVARISSVRRSVVRTKGLTTSSFRTVNADRPANGLRFVPLAAPQSSPKKISAATTRVLLDVDDNFSRFYNWTPTIDDGFHELDMIIAVGC
ncbi:hypothetical protein DACRYDRAFT_23083 [Dacryopinax primogenitus]|uniref:Uncharacterized protein n=1 Tax=Dacryopinax primogenitus (strain DJM 731) TaxID=1858805 RepID=M5G4H8_DACPD|nr:uncharacterized protein DACRYDRAFT_23083 [Dacryopinax primogenitus]EJU00727.1 hypothetical protein DACRYDRAFT_23083 [Dacryopinax primogenitus]